MSPHSITPHDCPQCSKSHRRESPFCSYLCWYDFNGIPLDEALFWGKFDRTGGIIACWPWLHYRTPEGYGQFRIKNLAFFSHRMAWEITKGRIPNGLSVCHSCDNPACGNPSHLWDGTRAENDADRDSKGRQASGERSGRHTHPEKTARGEIAGLAKLKNIDIPIIRQQIANGYGNRAIAKLFNVHHATIWGIRTQKTWRHII